MTLLSVNVNKFATLRNSRTEQRGDVSLGSPSVVAAAQACVDAGAGGITVHPRPDGRHITLTDVRELASAGDAELDFLLEAPLPLWREMFESIQESGHPDVAYTLNSLSHVGNRMKVVYDDPEGHDKLYRFMATLQAFVDQASDLEIEWA